MVKIKKGLSLPITGEPKQEISKANQSKKVALIASDYVGMKPTMKVKEGDSVLTGQVLFEDKKNPGVLFTSPAQGKVVEINRGDKRAFQSIVIEVSGNENVKFANYNGKDSDSLNREEIKKLLIESGEWTALRTRPYSKSPAVDSTPHSIFVTAMDTNPLCADAELIIGKEAEAFQEGVKIVAKLTDGKVFLCTKPNSQIRVAGAGIVKEEFAGPHPAGNAGTHIHFLDPVSSKKTVWHIGYQDVIAIGHLFKTGKLYTKRIVSFAGPQAKNPRLLETVKGACLCDIASGETKDGDNRLVSGSVFNGRIATKSPFCYLGRFHNQITILKEGKEREFLGWNSPGLNKFSVKSVFLSKLFPSKKFAFTTNANGSLRSIVPIGSYEKVMPLDIQPTFLLRSLLSHNTEKAQQLGCLELDEEDLALCSFVDPCKNEFGPILRNNLTSIEKDG